MPSDGIITLITYLILEGVKFNKFLSNHTTMLRDPLLTPLQAVEIGTQDDFSKRKLCTFKYLIILRKIWKIHDFPCR